jgi:hypothetical protein
MTRKKLKGRKVRRCLNRPGADHLGSVLIGIMDFGQFCFHQVLTVVHGRRPLCRRRPPTPRVQMW